MSIIGIRSVILTIKDELQILSICEAVRADMSTLPGLQIFASTRRLWRCEQPGHSVSQFSSLARLVPDF